MTDRTSIARSAAAGLRVFARRPDPVPVLIGFDGFVDSIIRVVGKRHGIESYDPIPTIADFGARIQAKAGQSSNYEMVVTGEKLGGNGPIMANAMAAAGVAVSYVGTVGYPSIHPAFAELAERAEVFSVAEPGHTDALEFDDGKLMLGKYETVSKLDWPTVAAAVGEHMFAQLVHRSRLIGMVNWTMLSRIGSVWHHIAELLAAEDASAASPRKVVFIDLSDPAKRTASDIRGAFAMLTKMQATADVVLGLNLSESIQALEVLGLPVPMDPEAAIEATAAAIRERLAIHACVVHPRKGAAAAVERGGTLHAARFAGPYVARPRLSTGAGDNFNAGFCLGLLADLPVDQCICAGVATSGYYVRNARSPRLVELAEFCDHLPPSE